MILFREKRAGMEAVLRSEGEETCLEKPCLEEWGVGLKHGSVRLGMHSSALQNPGLERRKGDRGC